MNKMLIIPITFVVATLSFVPDAMSLGKNHHYQNDEQRERTPKLLTKRAAKHLDLSEQQQSQIKDVYEQMRVATADDRDQMHRFKKQWKQLAQADTLDESAL